MNRTVKIKKISNGYITTTYAETGGYEHYCKDFDELCLWIKENLDSIRWANQKKDKK